MVKIDLFAKSIWRIRRRRALKLLKKIFVFGLGSLLYAPAVSAQKPVDFQKIARDAEYVCKIWPLDTNFSHGGSGSCFLIELGIENWYVLTNNHVLGVDEYGSLAAYAIVHFNFKNRSKTPFVVRLAGYDPFWDIALLKIVLNDQGPLVLPQPAILGNSDDLKELDPVLAVSSAYAADIDFNFRPGRVADPEAPPFSFPDFGLIETDLTVHHGGSGSPLIDSRGRVVGMISYKYPDIPYAYAIPISRIKLVLPFLARETGKVNEVVHTTIAGLSLRPCLFKVPTCPVGSVLVDGVNDTLTALALKKGDVIISVDGEKVKDLNHLIELFSFGYAPGDTIDLTVLRREADDKPYSEIKAKVVLEMAFRRS